MGDFFKTIPINGQNNDVTGYQVKVIVGESASASGYDVHVEGNSESFPTSQNNSGDLRFADSNNNLYDFWVEEVTGSAGSRVATCWVEVGANMNTDPDLYLYYGNAGAGNVSDPDATLLEYDDFESGFDTNKWERVGSDADSENVFVSNGYLQVEQDATDDNIDCYSVFTLPEQAKIISRTFVHIDSGNQQSSMGKYITALPYGFRYNENYFYDDVRADNDGFFCPTPMVSGDTFAPNIKDSWFREEVAYDNKTSTNNVYGEINGQGATYSRSNQSPSGDIKLRLRPYAWFNPHYLRLSYFALVKWRANDPTLGTPSGEQSAGGQNHLFGMRRI